MASAQEIAALRLLIAEPDNTAPYDDATLGLIIDAATNIYAAAYEVWTQKAASTAGLVDISEGGSSRNMGDLHEQALSMAEQMRQRALADSQPPDGSGAGTRIRKLTRS